MGEQEGPVGGMVGHSSWRDWWLRPTTWIVGVAASVFVYLGVVTIVFGPEPLLTIWLPQASVEDRGKLLATATQTVLFGLGGFIAVVTLVLNFFRHQSELDRLSDDRDKEDTRRDEWEKQRSSDIERELRARFVTTIELLSAIEPTKRSAALYALGALVDDWDAHGRKDEAQVCLNVFCQYLRKPPPALPAALVEERTVLQAGYDVIGTHLRPGKHSNWGTKLINLTGAHIIGILNLQGATISRGGLMLFNRATISEDNGVFFYNATISEGGRVFFDESTISQEGGVFFGRATISEGGKVSFSRATISQAGAVSFKNATINQESEISLLGATISGSGEVLFDGARITVGGEVVNHGAAIGGSGPVVLPDGRHLTPGESHEI